jgi:PhnB protein
MNSRKRSRIYIPPGFNTVTPYFFVANAESFVCFLVQGLGGTETCRTMRPNGLIQNVQVKLGTSTVMVSEATEHYKPMAAAYYLYIEDVDASMQRALKHGAILEMEVGDMPYGDRQGGVKDRHGNIWWISQRTVHEPYTS